MRIRIRQRPTITSIDGLELGRFEPGGVYEVGTTLGMLMLAEDWAEPEGPADAPLSASAVGATVDRRRTPANCIREFSPPYADRLGIATDFEQRERRRRVAIAEVRDRRGDEDPADPLS
jgi:hypothetical protein